MTQTDAFFAEVCAVLERYQPQLSAKVYTSHIEIEGRFVCRSEEGPFDEYEIAIEVRDFPRVEPTVREVGGRIPHTIERHVYPASGNCCLGHWAVWLLKTPTPSFENFVAHHLTSYFVGQTVFEITGVWPFGEEGHGRDEIRTSYREALNLPVGADELAYAVLLGAPLLRGNPLCPCRSGKRLRECHWGELRALRKRYPADVRKRIASTIGKSEG